MSNTRKLRGGPSPQMPPHVRAVADQAGAADSQLMRVAASIGQDAGTTPRPAGRVACRIIMRLRDRMAADGISLCPHLSRDSPAPCAWYPRAPEAVRCPACAVAARARIRGTGGDRRCDGCGQLVMPVRPRASLVRGVAGELRDGTVAHRPPVLLLYGLCRDCWQADCEPSGAPPGPPGPHDVTAAWRLASRGR